MEGKRLKLYFENMVTTVTTLMILSRLLYIQSVAEATLIIGAEGVCLFWPMVLLYAALQLQETDWIKQFSIR